MIDYSASDALQQAQSERDQARQRLMALASARQNYMQKLQSQYDQQVTNQQNKDYEGNINILGNVGTGAASGAMFGPWGALAGGVIGLGTGALEAYNARKQHGDKNAFWNTLGDAATLGIAGTVNQAQHGKFSSDFLIPGSKYAQSPLSSLGGAIAGGVANKMAPAPVTDQAQFNKDYTTYVNSGTAMTGAPGQSSVYSDTTRQLAAPSNSNSLYDQNLYQPSGGLSPNDPKWARFYPTYGG